MSPQPLQLIIYPSPLFAAHWALFLPSPSDPNQKAGTRIHADGSPASGFEVIFESEYDLNDCTQSYRIINLGEIEAAEVEKAARVVEAPKKTLVATSVGGEGPRRRVELKNCQTWLRDVVEKIVENGALGEEVMKILDSAPKN
ncbi:uncharacterized protein BDR25DRAFT_279577 [Lindgomyces ingoldianus]|uniref:Uncharacterized protein n=1 Tax=Lindgomyces ingoldianus TaxID=673940 RepID=A0ACB6RAY5_9PLEO|nr:uncharacterized protein BDR25DRAFT_279577 [Lindgomyces ingoldianus]KAF2475492.1 hypothetical protein BDR25DRAFT_279577 [Lindgomyces ingoldianus]